MSKVRFGVISTARIGVDKVIPAMQQGDYCEIAGIASRDMGKAQAAADKLGIANAFGSYEELLADPQIDAIYNPLPNHLHVPVSIQALQAGKHVLCEKPIGMSANEGRQLIEAHQPYSHLKLMEAFMYRHHPQTLGAKDIVDSGGVGKLRTIHSFFSYHNVDAADIRNLPEAGGGGLMDIGCYNISVSRFMFGRQPVRVFGHLDYDPQFGTDRMTSAILDFGEGTATFTCSTQLIHYQRVNIYGDTGRVEVEIPFNAPHEKPCKIWHQQGAEVREIEFETCNQYTVQGDLFARSILDDTPVPTPMTDAVENMEVIEAIVQSGKTGGWVSL